MKGVTQYVGFGGFYSRYLLKQIIKAGDLDKNKTTILDFGCGNGELKRLLNGNNVIGFDIIPALSDIADWRSVQFDILVSNQVFYSFSEDDLEALLRELESRDPKPRLVVGISRQGILNNIGKYLLGKPDAHFRTKISPKREKEILKKHCNILRRKNVLGLSDVYLLSFKSSP